MYRDKTKLSSLRTSRLQTQANISRLPNTSFVGQKETKNEQKDLARLKQIFSLEDCAEDSVIQLGKHKQCVWSPSHQTKTKEGNRVSLDGPLCGQSIHCNCTQLKGQKEDKMLSQEKTNLSRNAQQPINKEKLGFGYSRTQKNEAAFNHKQQERKMIEEFILDDNELCLFNFYDIPVDVTKHYRMRKSAKLKTVSIIDTLSELALGAVDREDDTGALSSCAMNQSTDVSSYLNHIASDLSSPSISNSHNCQIKDTKSNFFVSPSLTSKEGNSKGGSSLQTTDFGHSFFSNCHKKSQRNEILRANILKSEQENNNNRKAINNNNCDFSTNVSLFHQPPSPIGAKLSQTLHNKNVEPIPCNSLKRTLRYLRKAVSSSGMEGNSNEVHYLRNHRHHRKRDDKDYSRMCLSDSEVRHTHKSQAYHGNTTGYGFRSKQKQGHSRQSFDYELFSGVSDGNKCKISDILPLSGNYKPVKQAQKIVTSKQQSHVPEWIQRIFHVAKKGDLVLLKTVLKDMDAALIRNLSDHNGNNLWHICAAFNHLECLQWLCTYDDQEVLVDENKSGLNPIIVAVKHGNFELTQWLIQHTSGVTQVAPPEGTRSLLHYAAKYGRERLCYWLSDYMEENNIDINRRDSGGNSSLHLAAKYGHIECAKCLILHGSDLMAKNELGFKPYNLAMCNGQEACADYLVAMETCFVLATEHLFLETDIKHLDVENTELKNHYKELLSLTRRVIRRQQKIWESLQKIKNLENSENAQTSDPKIDNQNISKDADHSWISRRENKQCLTEAWLEEYGQWLSEVTPDDKDKLQLIEENWRKVRKKQTRRTEDRNALDIVRYKFSQIMCKATESHYGSEVRMMSSSETSLSEESLQSEDDSVNPSISQTDLGMPKSSLKLFDTFSSLSHKDAKSLSDNISKKVQKKLENLTEKNNDSSKDCIQKELQTNIEMPHKPQCSIDTKKNLETTTKPCSHHTVSAQAISPSSHSSVSSALRWDINLRLFFDRNPELRQEGKTCSVLEVLEPSSSESEDWIQKKKKSKHSKNNCKEEKWESGNSSSSSMHSSSDCKLHSMSCSQTKNFQRIQTENSNKEIENNSNENKDDNNKTESIENLKTCKFNSPYLLKKKSSTTLSEQNTEYVPSTSQHEVQTQLHYTHQNTVNSKELDTTSDDHISNLETIQNKWEKDYSVTNVKTVSQEKLQINNCEGQQFSEPDLIKGTQKVNLSNSKIKRNEMIESNNKLTNKADYYLDKDIIESSSVIIGEELDAKPEVEQIIHDENADKLHSQVEINNSTANIKKKSFLLKFSLKGRWSSKQKPQATKKVEEITPEEFRETYSRSSFQNVNESNYISDVSYTSSQVNKIQDTKYAMQTSYQSKLNNETCQKETVNYVELRGARTSDYNNMKCTVDNSNSSNTCILPSEYIPPPLIPLPLRREPPPIPISNIEVISNEINHNPQSEISQDLKSSGNTNDDLSCNETVVVTGVFQPSQVKMASITPRTYIPSLSSGDHNSMTPWSSTVKSDSLSRPSSSASHLDLPSRSDDTYKSGFPLHKDSSASTEMLLVLDSSTAGRQSPAPSEISKTESALSPPSDVSKTESIRQLNQLGKIEESTNIHREPSGPLMTFPETINLKTETTLETCADTIDSPVDNRNINAKLETRTITENSEIKEINPKIKLNNSRKNDSGDKPWYEVSDDDDLLTAHHFKMVSVSMRSSSEDEAEGIAT